MRKRKEIPIALTIAGSDSGGGAGVQADLKTFAALGVHGATVITCLTAQNPRQIIMVEACSTKMVQAQIEAVFAELPPRAVKTGMIFSADIIKVVARWFRSHPSLLVVDPVMIATSGARLLKPDAMRALTHDLLPLATLVTPNVPEAEALLGVKIHQPEDLRHATRALHERFGCAALVKGGHLRGTHQAIDIFYDGRTELLLSSPRVRGVSTHGTGCTYSASIAAYLCRGLALPRAVQMGKKFISAAIAGSVLTNRHGVLNQAAGGRR